MGKMLLLYRQKLLAGVGTMLLYAAIVAGGVWLTDIDLFETYLLIAPAMAMMLPSMFCSGDVTNLALGFGASRRHCFWGQQLASLLTSLLCLAMAWLTFRLGAGGMTRPLPADAWNAHSAALLFARCLCTLQGGQLSQTVERGWRRTLLVVGSWAVGFLCLMLMEVMLLISDGTLPAVLYPVRLDKPFWLAVLLVFSAGALIFGVAARLRFAKLVVRL